MAVTVEEAQRRTNERPGTRAQLRNLRTSAYKVREVLDLIRGEDVTRAEEILRFCERGPAVPIAKLLKSAVSNAVENDQQVAEELFIATAYADEGVTMKRFKPRARGRAGRIRKRSSHITLIVSRLPEDRLERLRAQLAEQSGSRRSRVAGSRAARVAKSSPKANEDTPVPTTDEVAEVETEVEGTVTPETVETEVTETAEDVTAADEAPAEEAPDSKEEDK